jgi:hypothetical protein
MSSAQDQQQRHNRRTEIPTISTTTTAAANSDGSIGNGGDGRGERRRKRIQNDELRKFYSAASATAASTPAAAATSTTSTAASSSSGGGGGGSLASSSTGGGRRDDQSAAHALDLDSASFKPKVYMKHLLTSETLPELLKTDSELIKEIKHLDNNMKTLVYDNYSKFITAASTIRKMKTKVESMEEEMSRLVNNIGTISSSSERISSTLQEKRLQIEQLSGVHHLLHRLQFLVELPSRLRQSIAMSAYGDAVQYYARTYTILEKYKHFPSFAPIAQQCTQIITDLKTVITHKFGDSDARPEQRSQYVELLLDLQEPPVALRTRYLDLQWAHFERLFSTHEQAAQLRQQQEEQRQPTKIVGASVLGTGNAAATTPQKGRATATTKKDIHNNNSTLPTEIENLALLSPVERLSRLNASLLPMFLDLCGAYGRAFIKRATTPLAQTRHLNALTSTVHKALDRYSKIVKSSLLAIARQGEVSQPIATNSDSATTTSTAVTSTVTTVTSSTPTVSAVMFGELMELLGGANHGFDQILSGYYDQMGLATLIGAGGNMLSPLVSPQLPSTKTRSHTPSNGSGIGDDAERPTSSASTPVDDVLGRTDPPPLKQPSHYMDETLLSLLDMYFSDLVAKIASVMRENTATLDLSPSQLAKRDYVASAVDNMAQSIGQEMRGVFAQFVPFMEAFNDGKLFVAKMFQHNLIARTRQFFDDLTQLFIAYTETAAPESLIATTAAASANAPTARPVLLVLCMGLGRLRKQANVLLKEVVFGPVLNLPDEDGQSSALLDLLQTTSHTLLTSYVRLEGIKIGQMIRIAVGTVPWLKKKEPSDVDVWIRTLVQHIRSIRQLVAALLSTSTTTTTATNTTTTTANPSSTTTTVSAAAAPSFGVDDFDGLFQKKASYFGKVEFAEKSIVTAIVNVALKTFVESVRVITTDRSGFQQLQVDCHYLSMTLQPLVSDAAQLNTILAEIISSSKDRSLDPVPVDKLILTRICSSAAQIESPVT